MEQREGFGCRSQMILNQTGHAEQAPVLPLPVELSYPTHLEVRRVSSLHWHMTGQWEPAQRPKATSSRLLKVRERALVWLSVLRFGRLEARELVVVKGMSLERLVRVLYEG
jgi:hypothetical protein